MSSGEDEREDVIDVDACLRAAVELKANVLASKRKDFTRAPEFVRNTVSRVGDEEYERARMKPVNERVMFANALIDQANALTRSNDHEQALEAYSDALATFCHFTRPSGTEKLMYVDHLSTSTTDEGAQTVKRIMLNAAACMMNEDLRRRAREIEWATTQALRVDGNCAAAYYRRGKARAVMEEEEAMEKAVDDLKRAVDIEPEEKRYVRALEQHIKNMALERGERRAVFNKMFSSTRGIYDETESRPRESSGIKSDDESDRILLDDELKAKAREMGFDVDSSAFHAELASRVRDEIRDSHRSRARDLGLDLEDDQVKDAIAFFERKRRQAELTKYSVDVSHSRIARWFIHALLAAVVARFAYVIRVVLTRTID